MIDSAAFDAFADSYDTAFTDSLLGRLLRPRVWEKLAGHFKPGQHILELACGTGEDAVWLAKKGVYVTATDGSPAMITQTEAKAKAEGVTAQVEAVQLSLQEITNDQLPITNYQFDGAFSNFGGLNTIGDWQPPAQSLARIIKPGGTVILVPMGPVCLWEIIWYVGHMQPGTAFRRFGEKASAQIGQANIPIWYPSAKKLRRDFSPWFTHLRTESLGLWLPPSYLDHFVNRWPKLFNTLNRFEKATARFSKGWGDHYIIVFQRKSEV